MFAFIRHILTEGDNKTVCPVRIGTVGSGVVYHLGALWMVLGQHAAVDMAMLGAYIQHMSMLAVAAAGGIGVRSALKSDAPAEGQP